MNSDSKFTRFRCITCELDPYPIHEMVPVKDIPVIDFHKNAGCELEYFTDETYKEYKKLVTQDSNTSNNNRHTKKYSMKLFIHKARIKNRMGFDFNRDDFPEITEGNFRQYILRATRQGLIEKVKNSLVPSYRVIGESTGRSYDVVTLKGMGVGLEFEKILRDTCISYPKIHDIRLKTSTEGLHEYLRRLYPVNKKNGGIKIPTFNPRPFTFLIVSVYPKTIEITIECSRMPIIYDTVGAEDFVLVLSEVRERLLSMTKYNREILIPSVLEWIVTQYHFNKDDHSKQYSGERFEVKVKEMSAGMIRFYSKSFSNGVTRPRLEQIRSPNTKILDEITKMIKTDNFVHNTAGIKLTHDEAHQILDIIPESSLVPDDINQIPKQPIMIMMSGTSFFNPIQDGVFSF